MEKECLYPEIRGLTTYPKDAGGLHSEKMHKPGIVQICEIENPQFFHKTNDY